VWGSNVNLIQSHNSEADAGVHSFHLGENHIADMTTDEIRSYFNGILTSEGEQAGMEFHAEVELTALPTSIDWRMNVRCKASSLDA
jgi:cathepsin S